MRYLAFTLFIISTLFIAICSFNIPQNIHSKIVDNKATAINKTVNTVLADTTAKTSINDIITGDLSASGFVEYAKTLVGTPYAWGSVNPRIGLDCSGFVNHVSNHFGIKVPRSSVQFTNVGTTIETNNAKPGDLILFTGTDPRRHEVGHIGIITGNQDGQLQFIHSASGKAQGVIITDLSDYYKTRLVKVIRIFPVPSDKVIS